MDVLFADSFDESLPGRLRELGCRTFAEMDKLGEAEVLLVRSKTKVTADLLAKAPRLKLVIRGGVGLDNVDKEACKARGIEVVNTPKASSVAVAELALAMMLAFPNRLIEAHSSMKEGRWLKKEIKRTELFEKTLGLVGAGLIGTEVARRCRAFGMSVLASDPYVKTHELAEMVDLDTLLAKADYISLHVPSTPETKGMIGKAALDKMKKGVYIVNTARGALVDDAALAEALKAGQVAGYATDVFPSEPPDAAWPLKDLPNVIMAPHIGASSKENLLRIGDIIVDILKQKKGAQA